MDNIPNFIVGPLWIFLVLCAVVVIYAFCITLAYIAEHITDGLISWFRKVRR